MSSSSSGSSSSDSRSSGSSSISDHSSGRNSVSEALSSSKVVVALKASQASKDGVEVDSFRSFHGFSYTFLRVESLEVRRLAQPSFHSGGHS